MVLSFFFTSCPTVCPRQVAGLAEVQRGLSPALRERVQFVSLSVDPETDSPEAMRKFALANGADLASWSFARANRAATDGVTRELAAFEAPTAEPPAPAGHTTAIYLFDPSGRLVQRYGGAPLDAPRLIGEVERLELWLKTKKET